VHVTVDEARKDRAPVELDDVGVRRIPYLSTRADGRDPRSFDEDDRVRDRSSIRPVNQRAAFK